MTKAGQFPATASPDTDVSFVEVPIRKVPGVLVLVDRAVAPAVIRTATFTIELTDSISDRLLSAILREVSHSCAVWVMGIMPDTAGRPIRFWRVFIV